MFTIIVNPTSGGRKAQRILPHIEAILRKRAITYQKIETPYPTESSMLAYVPCGKDDTVCVVGGDGTVLNILNVLPSLEMTFICVPCGTGNDFVKTLKLPEDPVEAFKQQLDGIPTHIDYMAAGNTNFINIAGVGFDVDVLKRLEEFKIKFTGLKAYIKAVVQAIKYYKPVKFEVSVDDGPFEEKSCTTYMVGNGKYLGGGMMAVPDANPFDGILDIVEIKPVNKLQLIMFLPKFIKGKHVDLPIATRRRCRKVVLRAKGLEYQLDGEIKSADELSINIIHEKMRYSL